ncbi:MAG: ATP-binding protein [Catalinimonas sp.]
MIKTARVPRETQQLKRIRDWMRRFLAPLDVSEQEQSLLIVAIDEICANAILHGAPSANEDTPDVLELRLEFEPPVLKVEITDPGRPFDYDDYHAQSVREIKESGRRGGLGLKLVERIMDRVTFGEIDGHNVCRLEKKLSVSAAG